MNYAFDAFDEEYYTAGSPRGGFTPEILNFDSPTQQAQLSYKWDRVSRAINFESILFVGCARGAEVQYFLERGKDAQGADVSRWAIENAEPPVRDRCRNYDGIHLDWLADDAVDVVASFDVLTLIPVEMRDQLIPEICRVAKNGIAFRTIIECPGRHGNDNDWELVDGVFFKYSPLDYWVNRFEASGKFRLDKVEVSSGLECWFYFKRR